MLLNRNYISEFHFFHFIWLIKKKFPHNPTWKLHRGITIYRWYQNIFRITENYLWSPWLIGKKNVFFVMTFEMMILRYLEEKFLFFVLIFVKIYWSSIIWEKKLEFVFLSAWNRRGKIAALLKRRTLFYLYFLQLKVKKGFYKKIS